FSLHAMTGCIDARTVSRVEQRQGGIHVLEADRTTIRRRQHRAPHGEATQGERRALEVFDVEIRAEGCQLGFQPTPDVAREFGFARQDVDDVRIELGGEQRQQRLADAIPRNRVRETLLPLLASEFNPNIVDVLAREAELARDVWSWLESELTTFGADLHVEDLKGAPLALRRLAVWRAMLTAADGRPVGFEHVDAALALLDARDGASVDAPGHRVQRKGGRLVLTQRGSKGAAGSQGSEVNLFCYPLSIPGEVVDSQRGFAVSVEPGTAASADVRTASTAVVRRDLIGNALAVRNRRQGDRFTPVGLHGRKKLQDYFVDRKIARET